MKNVVLLTALLMTSGQGISPCPFTKSQSSKSKETLSLKEVCQAEQNMSLLRDDMSVEETLKALGVWKHRKRIFWKWGGGFTNGSLLGEDYYLVFTFLGFPDARVKL